MLFGIAADLAHHQDGVRIRVCLKQRKCVDEARPVDRVAADANARALADAQVGELPHALVRQRARSADHANPPRFVNVPRHDADLARPGRDDARAVRPNQPRPGMMCFQVRDGLHHVDHWNALGDRHDHLDAGVGRFHDRVGRKGWRHKNHGCVGTGRQGGLAARVENRHAQRGRSPPPRRDASHQIGAVCLALLGVESPGLAGDSLTDQLRVLVDQNAHQSS